MNERVSVIGLGKLGACMAATMASKGMHVVGVDVNSKNVEALNQGMAPVVEPGLSELITANRSRLKATTHLKQAIFETEITFIIVPTPSDDSGGFSLRYVLEAARGIASALREKAGYHLVVLTSTVLPGSVESALLPILEGVSGKSCGKAFGLCYNPEFIALGSVIRDLLNPDFLLIGESDPRAGELLLAWYKTYCDNHPRVARMNFVNAELVKISVNSFVTTKITFANTLSDLCERLPGADIDTVSAALGLDSRIGRSYLTGALGYAGPCFPRDNQALVHVAQTAGGAVPLAETTDKTNRALTLALADKVRGYIRPGMTVSILGLAYKPDTNVVEDSQGLALANALAKGTTRVIVFDPLAMDPAREILKDKVQYAATLSEALRESDLIVIANPCSEFKRLEPRDFLRKDRSVIVLDCWRILRQKLSDVAGISYIPFGVGDVDSVGMAEVNEALG